MEQLPQSSDKNGPTLSEDLKKRLAINASDPPETLLAPDAVIPPSTSSITIPASSAAGSSTGTYLNVSQMVRQQSDTTHNNRRLVRSQAVCDDRPATSIGNKVSENLNVLHLKKYKIKHLFLFPPYKASFFLSRFRSRIMILFFCEGRSSSVFIGSHWHTPPQFN